MKYPYISGTNKSVQKCGYSVSVKEVPIFIDCLGRDCPFYDDDTERCRRADEEMGECI